MDERHWWIATKIQETFQVDDTDSPTALEQFLVDPNQLSVVTQFFAADGLNKLFIYGRRPENRAWMQEDLNMTTSLINISNIGMNDFVCVFFLRQSTHNEVEPMHLHRDIYCGEIKSNPLHQLSTVLSQVFYPLLRSQRDWQKCPTDHKQQFLHNVEKYVNVFASATNKSDATKQQILRLPETLVSSDFKQHRISSQFDSAVIREYESVVQDWMQTIDGVLSEGNDERLLDVHSGPLTEVDRWHRRQRVLATIMEQLKTKECKNVIGVLIQAKSKLLKKWKAMDLFITDAQNETKDKVKYLEALRRHLEQLHHENNPAIAVNIILPALIAAIRQMESVSRYYARSGYLGLLCKKICNDLANLCREHVMAMVKDNLWKIIEDEVSRPESTPPVFKINKRGIRRRELIYEDDKSLVGRLKACLSLHVFYRDLIRSMKDTLGAAGSHSLAQSQSSIDTVSARVKKPRGSGTGARSKGILGAMAGPSSVVSGSDGKDYSTFGYGVSMADEDMILGHLDSLCGRMRQMLDIIASLRQFTTLAKDTAGLPRPRLEDIPLPDSDDKSSIAHMSPQGTANTGASVDNMSHEFPENTSATKQIGYPHFIRQQQSMGPLQEEEEEDEISRGNVSADINKAYQRQPPTSGAIAKRRISAGDRRGGSDIDSDMDLDEDRSMDFRTASSPGSPIQAQFNAAGFLRRLYSIEMPGGEEGPGLCSLISDHVNAMIKAMRGTITTSMLLDVHGKLNDRFEDSFNQFTNLSQDLDQLLSVYLAAIFAKSMKTQQGLNVLAKFKAVAQRPSMSNVIAERYSDVYSTFSQELYRIQEMYEENKDNPIVPRDAPPAAGAIYWTRQLMSHIEEPMKIFQENKTLNQSKEYHRAVKIYNRIATALVTCETLWYQQWIKSVDHALNGLRVSLLIPNPVTGELSVNVDQKILNLIQETKWMLRMNLEVPSAAKTILARETQFKKYKMHLEQCLYDYKEVCGSIPRPFIHLFRPHTDTVLQCLQAGLNTITWDSMNIDAFLHKIRSSTNRLKRIVEKVCYIADEKINKSVSVVSETILFDQQSVLGKTWTTEALLKEMQDSTQKGAMLIKEHAQVVENAIHEIIDILSSSRINSADHGHGSIAAPGTKVANPPPGRKPGPNIPRRGTRVGSGSTVTGVSNSSSIQAQQRFAPDQATIQDILSHYSKQMYSSVHKSICNTLSCLCEAFGVGLNMSSENYDEQLHHRTELVAISRPGSSSTEATRPSSVLSSISTLSWKSIVDNLISDADNEVKLKIKVQILFRIPDILLDPPLSQVQQVVDEIVEEIISTPREITWWAGVNKNETFESQILIDESITIQRRNLSGLTRDLRKRIRSYVGHLSQYNFLWKDDMHRAYSDFMCASPNISAIRKEVENLLDIEQKISSIPVTLPAGCIVLCPGPIMDALQGLAAAWKTQYALVLHEDAKKKLDSVVQYRNNVQNRLSAAVITLDQLNGTLSLIDEIHDMENKIDGVYLPIEKMYEKLKEYDLRLARSELQQVDSLRQNWSELVQLADRLGHTLLKERRASFEQELDKQLKTFVVEVIQFRNAFDAQGPAIPGVRPAEAVIRLQEFQNRFTLYDAKRKTLDSVQRLFGILPKPFPELDKTGEELKLLGMLYGLFQKFIAFDRRFRDTLWENAGLHTANIEVRGHWDECLNLPDKLKDWDAYTEMKKSIKTYLNVFPLLHRLAEKGKFKDIMIPKIRNRHWLQVMSVTFSKFQLESNIFKMGHLLDIGLLEHSAEIEQICNAANKELELEVKMRGIEEEWTEQVLSFENYKRRGPVLLVKEDSERLLELLEDAQALLATMLTSKHIGPLREEAASWAEKLKGVSEVLDTWLETQDLWQELEAVFSDHATAKELPQEAKRFSMVDKSYVKLMRRAYDTRNILQCCYGGEVPKDVVLRHMQEELEICFKSLTQYLDKKRAVFPRFHFLTDSVLLAVLSRPNDLESVRTHLRSIFASIADIKTEKTGSWSETVSSMKSLRNTPTPDSSPVLQHNPETQRRNEDAHHRASGVRFKSRMKSSDSLHFSASYAEEPADVLHATAVLAADGEILNLDEEISLFEGAELWLQNLQDSVRRSLHSNITKAIADIDANTPLEEIVLKYPIQVGKLALLYLWTRECEAGIAELKWERKAMQNASKKFSVMISRLPTVINRTTWKGGDEAMLPVHRARLENLIHYSVHLRDSLDGMGSRKMRDISDFEWRRSIRFYSEDVDGFQEHNLHILDNQFHYGLEFYGLSSSANLVIAPATERAFVSMSIALAQCQGSAVVGNASSGKTETVMGLASLFGKYIFMINCTRSTDATSLGKILQGLAADGCWGCLDDVHLLSPSGISVILEFSYKIFSSMQKIIDFKRQDSSNYGDNDAQVNLVNPGSAMFITYNPSAPHFKPLPTAIRSLYRTVSIIKPDMSAILKAKCTALGLRSPKALADRLKTLVELSHQQLPRSSSQHHEVSLQSLLSALTLAAQKRKARDERSEAISRSDTVTGSRTEIDQQKLSRSNSQTSVRQPPSPVVAVPSRPQAAVSDKLIGKKTNMPNTLTGQAKIDHGLVAQAIIETISPGLSPSDTVVFHFILKDTFSGIPMVKELLGAMSATGSHSITPIQTQLSFGPASSRKKEQILEPVLTHVANERGLIPGQNWLSKAAQLYQTAEARQGVVLAGPAGCGKSVMLSVLIDALCKLPHNPGAGRTISPGMSNHKLQKLHPLTVDDLSLMFGQTNNSREWSDGILTYAWRKANRNQSTTWLCLDGPLVSSWADRLNGALSDQKVMQLSNGDRLYLTDNMRVVFETTDLRNASPSLLSRTGLVYLDKNVLGWRPLAKAWLEQRNADEKRVLEKAFDKTLDSVCNFVFHDKRIKLPVCEVGLLTTCLTLLGEMLNEHQQHIGGDLHIERLYLFCLVWAFGGLLEGNTVKTFSDLLRTLSSALPDYDHDISVFDYYVDESGEWDTWMARVPEATYTGTTDMLGEVFVDTVDTIRTRCLLDFAHMARKHTLVVGESGIGKTALVNDFLDTQDKQFSILRRLVFSRASTASQLHSFMQHNIQHRQGFVYGARDGKFLEAFIDDLNLPSCDIDGVQRCNELLRSLVDDQTICKLNKPFEWRTVEGLEVLATMSVNAASPGNNLDPRLLRHFAVFRLRSASSTDVHNVIFSVLEANMSDKPLTQELHESIALACSKLLEQLKEALRPSPLPGRQHYAFCLRQIIKMCQCLKRVDEENRSSETYVVAFWKHEMQRLFADQLCRSSDLAWFEREIENVTKEFFSHAIQSSGEDGKSDAEVPPVYFTTFAVDAKVHHRPLASSTRETTKVKLYPLPELRAAYEYLQAHVIHYNEDRQVTQDSITRLMLSDDVLLHVIRMHRVLSYSYGGSMTVVGAVGSHLSNLTKLALHVAGLQPFKVDASRPATFFDSLRTAVRIAGTEGVPVVVVLTARDLYDPSFLDAINSLLIAGEYPHLFSNDEIEGLLQVLAPILRRSHPNMMSDPMKFFVSRVKCNLHIVLNLPPNHKLLRDASQAYPGIVSETQIIWIRDWPQEVLIQQAEFFINNENVAKEASSKTREYLTMAIANIHSLTLRDCKQTLWSGDTNPTVSVTGTSLQTKKDKETIKVEKYDLPNLPYSKTILLERINLLHRDFKNSAANEIYIGPYTYRKFMHCLHTLYNAASEKLRRETGRLQHALDTLDETRKDARLMQKAIGVLKNQFSSAQIKVKELFTKLTIEATRLEKLKAHLGIGNGPLIAFLQQLQQDDEDEFDDDTLLLHEERDEYDELFEQMMEANLKSKRMQIDEDLVEARKELDEATSNLTSAKAQVEMWRNKVDRGCIERLKKFQNPPVLVAQVLEMVMVLVGANPYLSTRPDQQSQMGTRGSETKTPKNGRREHTTEPVESRVSSGSTLRTTRKVKAKGRRQSTFAASNAKSEGLSAADRNKWKSMQNFMNDTVRFVEMIHAVNWETGLEPSLLTEVESYLKKGKEGQEGVTGEGSLLEHTTSVQGQQRKPNMTGITISSARYSSEDAAVLVEFVISIVEYTILCGPLKSATDKVNGLEAELEQLKRSEIDDQKPQTKSDQDNDTESDTVSDAASVFKETNIDGLTKDDVEKIADLVNDLQEKYDNAVVRKHHLRTELRTSKERLRSALATLESLKPLENAWKNELDESVTVEQVLTNCILAAAFQTYCGGMTIDARRRMVSFYTHVCKHYELPLPHKMLFTNYRLQEFIFEPTEVQSIRMKKLPTDNQSLENACVLAAMESNMTWCLICDPTTKIVDWINGYFSPDMSKENHDDVPEEPTPHLVQVLYRDLRSQFETSLSEGQILLVTYCDVEALARDDRFHQLFRCRSAFLKGNTPFKMMVGDHEVECNPNFRMFLHTTSLPQHVPPELAAYTTLLYNQTTRDGIKTELLDRFMRHEKPRLRDEWTNMQIEKSRNMKVLAELQNQLKDILVGGHRLLNDLNVTHKLTEIKKNYDDAMEMQTKIANAEESIERAKEGFTEIAIRGSVLYQTVTSMSIVNPLYYTSWQRFMGLYDENIRQSERSSLKAVCNQMTYNIFSTISKSLLEKDRHIFSLMTALEVEDSLGNVNIGEREYLIAPSYGGALMSALGHHPSETRSQAKKIFDWMSEEQFHNVQVLGMYYDWFYDSFDRMPKEGREMQWRVLCEADSPEQTNKNRLPDNADTHYTPLQRLLVIRGIRSDRIVQASTEFVISVLGKKYIRDEPPDIATAVRQSDPNTPIILLFTNENNSIHDYMKKQVESNNEIKLQVIEFVGEGSSEEKKVRTGLSNAMDNGTWLLLHNVQLNKNLLNTVYSIVSQSNNNASSLTSHGSSRDAHANFRLFLSCSARANALPDPLLHTSIKLVIDHPKGMKDNLLRFFSTVVDADIFTTSTRPEYLPCLHNICLLHGAVSLRSKFPINVGWQDPHAFKDINIEQLKMSLDAVQREFTDMMVGGSSEVASSTNAMIKNISWSGLRYQIAELTYGNYVTNANDQQSLNCLVDYWLASNSVKREFELPKVRYRLPAVFFTANTKQTSVSQALESSPHHALDCPEGCNLHPSPEGVIGNDQYIFTRLNQIYDAQPESKTLSHKLYPQPPTSLLGPHHTSISSSSSHPWILHRGVFATHVQALLKNRKEIELWEICYNALSKIPKTWNRDYLAERIKKIGGQTTFNLFLHKEMEKMNYLLLEIKRSLTSVKNAVETLDHIGDHMTPADVETSDYLYYGKIPQRWMVLAGETAPPDSTSLTTWLNDLGQRSAHLERILMLGRDKVAAYWLGAFFNPHALMSIFKQEAVKNHLEKYGSVDNIVVQTEITQRDKDHLRDPPSEGIFIHGVYLWGSTWEKTTGEMQDSPPKRGPTGLPVIHVTFVMESTKLGTTNDLTRPIDYYSCPVFVTTTSKRKPVFDLDVSRDSIPSSRWALRGLTATVRQY
ncbi:uncharacterized protein LOC120348568 isoform X2 [Styela clava]